MSREGPSDPRLCLRSQYRGPDPSGDITSELSAPVRESSPTAHHHRRRESHPRMSTLHRITLLGSGVLGSQISFHSAYRGKTVTVYDVSATALAACRENHRAVVDNYQADIGATDADTSAALARLTYTTDL